MNEPRRAPALSRPLPLVAIGVLALNDHLLKGSGLLPAWLTGKLSDVAGLFFFPLALAIVLSRVTRGAASAQALVVGSALATAAAFAAVKTIPAANAAVRACWGAMALDPTDLLALPAVALAVWWWRRTPEGPSSGVGERVALALAAAACVATAPSPPPPCAPGTPTEPPRAWDELCARPGKVEVTLEGAHATVTLPLTARGDGCALPLGLELAYDVPGAHAEVTLRPAGTPTPIMTQAPLEASAALPYPATCPSVTVRALVSSNPAAGATPRPDASAPTVRTLPLLIGACHDGAPPPHPGAP